MRCHVIHRAYQYGSRSTKCIPLSYLGSCASNEGRSCKYQHDHARRREIDAEAVIEVVLHHGDLVTLFDTQQILAFVDILYFFFFCFAKL